MKMLKLKIKNLIPILLTGIVLCASCKQELHQEDPGLKPPKIILNPGGKYSLEELDYGMNMGIEKTPGGRFWMCWTGGGDDPSSFMLLAWSDDKGQTWTPPVLAVDGQDESLTQFRTVQNGNLWTDPNGHLWFFFDQAMMDFDGRAGVWYIQCKNPDSEEPQWSEPQRLWHGTAKSKPVIGVNGEWILPVSLLSRKIIFKSPSFMDAYRELDTLRKAHVFISVDQGKSWIRAGGVRFPDPSYDEHHIVVLEDGRLWMTARTNDGIWQSFSNDGGYTWSIPEKYLDHISSRHFIRKLKDGRLILVKHGKINERTSKRSHLMAFVSENEGQTWSEGLLIDEREGISYPDGFEDENGIIHITYDYERARHGQITLAKFSPQDILLTESGIIDPGQKRLIYEPGGLANKMIVESLELTPDPHFFKLPSGVHLIEASGIAVDSKGHIYVLHRGEEPLMEFNRDGNYVRSLAKGVIQKGHGLKIDKDDNIWIVDRGANTVTKLNQDDQVLMVLGRWGFQSDQPEQFNQPTDIAFDSRRNIYVTDGYGNERVVMYDKNGRFQMTWGSEGTGHGQFSLPHSIVIDSLDRLYVGDRNNNRIQIFDREGHLLKIWDKTGSPWGMAIHDGQFYMVDGHQNRLVQLDYDGNIIKSYGSKGKIPGRFEFAHMLAIDNEHNFYIAEILNWRVQKLTPKSASGIINK